MTSTNLASVASLLDESNISESDLGGQDFACFHENWQGISNMLLLLAAAEALYSDMRTEHLVAIYEEISKQMDLLASKVSDAKVHFQRDGQVVALRSVVSVGISLQNLRLVVKIRVRLIRLQESLGQPKFISWSEARRSINSFLQEVSTAVRQTELEVLDGTLRQELCVWELILDNAENLEKCRFMQTILSARRLQREVGRMARTKTVLSTWFKFCFTRVVSIMSIMFDRIKAGARSTYGFDPNLINEEQYVSVELEDRVAEFLGKQQVGVATALCVVANTEVALQLPLAIPESEKASGWSPVFTRTSHQDRLTRSNSSNTSISSRFLGRTSSHSLWSLTTDDSSSQSLSRKTKTPSSRLSDRNSGQKVQWTKLCQLLKRLEGSSEKYFKASTHSSLDSETLENRKRDNDSVSIERTGSLYVVVLSPWLWLTVIVSPDETDGKRRRKNRGLSDQDIRSFLNAMADELRPAGAFWSARIQAQNDASKVAVLSGNMAALWKTGKENEFLAALRTHLGLSPSLIREDETPYRMKRTVGNGLEADEAAALFFLGPQLGSFVSQRSL